MSERTEAERKEAALKHRIVVAENFYLAILRKFPAVPFEHACEQVAADLVLTPDQIRGVVEGRANLSLDWLCTFSVYLDCTLQDLVTPHAMRRTTAVYEPAPEWPTESSFPASAHRSVQRDGSATTALMGEEAKAIQPTSGPDATSLQGTDLTDGEP